MSKHERNKSILRVLLKRYRSLPRDLHSRKFSVRNRAQRLLALTICIPAILWGVLYITHQIQVKQTIEHDNSEYRTLYESASASAAPTNIPAETTAVMIAETVSPTKEPQKQTTTAAPETAETPVPSDTIEPTDLPGETAEVNIISIAEPENFDIAEDEPITTAVIPDSDTVIRSIETAPPVRDSFADLLGVNPETVGYLTVGSQISLPVVQRKNDNEYYLSHNLSGEDSEGGTLFMDGSNLLVPEDRVLFVYGHNMRNGTMFQPLTNFERLDYFRSTAVIRFDTIYEEKRYTPAAVFRESVNTDSEGFFDIRVFAFDDTLWELYRMKIEKLSIYEGLPELREDDKLLMLITCEYTHDNGRLVVVLRELRDGETEEDVRAVLANAQIKQ